MQTEKFPFAVRLVGFPQPEAAALAAQLERAPAAGPGYFCLSDDSLQEPDLFIANGDELKALAALAALTSGALRPALVLGTTTLALPYPNIAKPADDAALFAGLALLVERRADAMAELAAAGLPLLPERRRNERLDFDLTDPAEYESQRRHASRGAVLVIDKNSSFSSHLRGLLEPYGIPVEWSGTEAEAVLRCTARAVSVALINTAIQIDPYRLCSGLRNSGGPLQPAVVFLVAPPFIYNAAKAKAAGAEGLLDKPVADHHLRAVLKKLMNIA